MPGAAETRRNPLILAHHGKALSDEFLFPVLQALGNGARRFTDDLLRIYLKEWREEHDLKSGASFEYPSPWSAHPGSRAVVSLAVRQPKRMQLSNSRTVDFPLLWKEQDNWLQITGSFSGLDHTNPADMTWFLERARIALPFFEPDFVCADMDVNVGKNFGEDPYSLAWPLAYYGSERAGKLGTDKLLKAPAWNVTEDERGGVWLQAAENPFNVDRKELRALADHLGLQRPK